MTNTKIYEIGEDLKKAGYPQEGNHLWLVEGDSPMGGQHFEIAFEPLPDQAVKDGYQQFYIPSIDELIEKCDTGSEFYLQKTDEVGWRAINTKIIQYAGYSTPIEAIVRLWISLNAIDAT